MRQKDFVKHAPDAPGIYMMKDRKGGIIYIGRATSLKDRMRSYFGPGEKTPRPIEDAIHEVHSIEFRKTDSLLEAIILESNLIKKFAPIYNVKDKDDRSFLYIAITDEEFPKVRLMRGQEVHSDMLLEKTHSTPPAWSSVLLSRPRSSSLRSSSLRSDTMPARRLRRPPGPPIGFSKQHVLALFGPYPSASLTRAALDIMRKIFHWSNCEPKNSPCFYRRIHLCPGICTGEINSKEYRRSVIKPLMLFLQGERMGVINNIEKRMSAEAKKQNFEQAATMRNQLFALKHINDVALLQNDETETRKEASAAVDIFGRMEGYDISNISGTNSVGSMVVFENGKPAKNEYRKFKIKYVKGINDVAMMKEVLQRRFSSNSQLPTSNKHWPLPDLVLVDGGRGQVNAAEEALRENNRRIPVLGLAKGFARKNDHIVYGDDLTPLQRKELERITENYMKLFKHIRDEAHRFAVKYHRQRRSILI